ncbi:MAG: hypothetical protein JW795_14425 [Chitinivibrionales bacterium]|nr:hypothetical protein [Chitinivibrionales bacterium]
MPLIQKAIDEKDWNAAQEWLVKPLSTLLHTSNKKPWYPEESLPVSTVITACQLHGRRHYTNSILRHMDV